jgi:hypothetical protein
MDRRSFLATSLSIAGVACAPGAERATSLLGGSHPSRCSILNPAQAQYVRFSEQLIATGEWGFESLGISGVANAVRLVDQQLRSGAIDITYSTPTAPCDGNCLGVLPSIVVTKGGQAAANLQEGCTLTFMTNNAFCDGSAASLVDSVLILGAVSPSATLPAQYVIVFPFLQKLVVFDGASYAEIPAQLIFAENDCHALQQPGELIGTSIFSLTWPVLNSPIFSNGQLVQFLAVNVSAVGCPGGDCTGFSDSCSSPPACTVFSICQGTASQQLTYLTSAQNATCPPT